jgi:hypothetical protein
MLRRMRVPELDAITLFMAPDNASSESASKRPADQFRAGSRYTNVCSLAEWRAGRARTCDPRRGRPMLNDDDLCDGVRPVPFHAPASDHVWIPAWLSRTVLISWGQPIHRHQELVAARQWRFKSSLPHQTLRLTVGVVFRRVPLGWESCTTACVSQGDQTAPTATDERTPRCNS